MEKRYSVEEERKRNPKRVFVAPKIRRMEKLHQVARFGVSGAPGLQTIGVAS